jgi:hypothetical protein
LTPPVGARYNGDMTTTGTATPTKGHTLDTLKNASNLPNSGYREAEPFTSDRHDNARPFNYDRTEDEIINAEYRNG